MTFAPSEITKAIDGSPHDASNILPAVARDNKVYGVHPRILGARVPSLNRLHSETGRN